MSLHFKAAEEGCSKVQDSVKHYTEEIMNRVSNLEREERELQNTINSLQNSAKNLEGHLRSQKSFLSENEYILRQKQDALESA